MTETRRQEVACGATHAVCPLREQEGAMRPVGVVRPKRAARGDYRAGMVRPVREQQDRPGTPTANSSPLQRSTPRRRSAPVALSGSGTEDTHRDHGSMRAEARGRLVAPQGRWSKTPPAICRPSDRTASASPEVVRRATATTGRRQPKGPPLHALRSRIRSGEPPAQPS